MRFRSFHKDFFGASDGAYSIVTERESYDSQITLTDAEAKMVIDHFGLDNIQVGNVASNREKAAQTFLLYPNGQEISLNLVFPKPEKTELRLYISSRAGFKPAAGNIWFLYKKDGRIFLGSLKESDWNSLNQTDDLDDVYQDSIESSIITNINYDIDPGGRIVTQNIGGRTVIARDPRLARMRFDLADNKCEIDPSHETFIAQRTQLPYVEAHHFIPMKFQHLYSAPLDNLENIVSLCPNCHRGIHHAIIKHKYELIEDLYGKRPRLHSNFSVEDIAQFYNALRITN
ncbi:HNH endonuclease [Fulvivirga sp. 29W222]|uniref:HNH endonuclease n=1 Tax=Fulvivirga marina TaxID=2494733 RepID=A0A937FXB1_9BACT|nr:HNH endonuclease [Fulvivirga marina]MBL6446737.1 HNH endonuclease [Fulvivirga marina]